jgi:Ca2+-transporting ATPase
MTKFYQLSKEETVRQLETDLERGLSEEEAAERLRHYGPNELIEQETANPWKILFAQFTEVMVIVLLVAALISLFLGEYVETVAILVIVILNALLGFRQEYQAERAMAALRKLAVPTVRVRRGGSVKEVASPNIVPGDVVLLEAGNTVPADIRLIEAINFRSQEAALTGESEPVNKHDGVVEQEATLAERTNMAYMGTTVTYGRGVGVVTGTGMATELGAIAELMQSAGYEPTPLQRRLAGLGKALAGAAFVLVLIVFVIGLLQGQDLIETFEAAIALAVAAVPEGLPAVVTIALALGARRMLDRQALIRKLPAVETLGSVTVICSDKTGTLTENRMTVTVVDVAEHRLDLTEEQTRLGFRIAAGPCEDQEPSAAQQETLRAHPALALLLAGGAVANDALLECEVGRPDDFQIIGDPTEGALVLAAARLGLRKETLEEIFPRVAEVPFESDRKRMSTVHRMPTLEEIPPALRAAWDWERWQDRRYVVFTKGAMDSLMDVSDRVWNENHVEPLVQSWIDRIEASNQKLAASGMRVLGVAVRALDDLPPEVTVDTVEQGLIFVGLTGMIDPARPEVKQAVDTAKTAGCRPIMITGDHPLTARYIAQELGFITNGPGPEGEVGSNGGEPVITGRELEGMPAEELEEVVARTNVFARVSPEHKLLIVQALQKRGHIAAMTGDGVNDAPALRKADIGLAMGITGTDVTKEASDMVLLDDNFATIVAAVEEGRTIYDNIRKFIRYTLGSNTAEIWVMLIAPFLGMPLPLVALQILWINLVTDGLPGLALAVEETEPNTMQRPPHPPGESIFARGLGWSILWVGLLMGTLSLGYGWWYWKRGADIEVVRTLIFTTIVLAQMFFVLSLRSTRYSIFQIGVFTNPALLGAVALTVLLQLLVIYVPFMQAIFETTALSLPELLISILLGLVLFVVVEVEKWVRRRA